MKSQVLLLVALCVSGCSTIEPAHSYGDKPLPSLKSAFVSYRKGSDPDIAQYICEALTQHGVKTSAGYEENRPKDVDFYATYASHKQWDMKMYLDTLSIQFLDGSSGQLIATGQFRNSALHTYPDVRKTTFDVVQSMYESKTDKSKSK